MEKTDNYFGENLRQAIKDRKMIYSKAAEVLEISLSALNQLMRGETNPSFDVLNNAINRLKIDPKDLFKKPGEVLRASKPRTVGEMPIEDLKALISPTSDLNDEETELLGLFRRLTDPLNRAVAIDTMRDLVVRDHDELRGSGAIKRSK